MHQFNNKFAAWGADC